MKEYEFVRVELSAFNKNQKKITNKSFTITHKKDGGLFKSSRPAFPDMEQQLILI